MSNTLILIALSVVSSIYLLIIRKNGKKLEITHFISTLLATLIGVLLAVTLSNNTSIKKEKLDAIKLLNSATHIIDMTYDYTVGLESFILELERDSTTNNDSIITIIKEKNPLPYPDLMETIISNELISKNISEFSYIQINSVIINLKRVREYDRINNYKRSLKELMILLELEIEFQNGNINLEVMNDRFIKKTNNFSQKFSDPNTIRVETEVSESNTKVP
ncbi:MAG: hypothetical protein DRJ07_21115 [Bacteroidetes bacterium]|nr:MAG: hypothetical protein DRJ07_21115 [Bacteroidota bacterium]